MTKAAGTEFRIRPIADTDLPAVGRLAGQLGYSASALDLADRLAPLAHSPAHAILVAELPPPEGGSVRGSGIGIVGWLHAAASLALIHDPQAEIVSLVVDEELRGRGVGAALVASAEAWARSRGLRRIRVRCQLKREDAHRFYAREGFAHQKTQHVFVKALARE